tara:strand:- start:79 stop:411 length:333 start_codon:yes stop_codon:yes gene_type:complete
MTEQLLRTATGLFFRFASEAAWLSAARDAGFITTVRDDDGKEKECLQAYTHAHAIDVIGIITEGGEWDEEDNEIVPPTILDGFHVNFIGDLPDSWGAFEVKPEIPVRVFA